MDPLTVENLARALHETHTQACRNHGYEPAIKDPNGEDRKHRTFDQETERVKSVRREQARLLLQRILM